MKKEIKSQKAPKAVGPYSQAVTIGNLVFVSGQIGLDPEKNMLKEGLEDQTKQIFINIKEILKSGGLGINDLIKVNVYLKNISDFTAMNKIYETLFEKPFPARATVGVTQLPKNALIEIDCIAYKNSHHDENDESGCCGECC